MSNPQLTRETSLDVEQEQLMIATASTASPKGAVRRVAVFLRLLPVERLPGQFAMVDLESEGVTTATVTIQRVCIGEFSFYSDDK
eukprot:gene9375-11902_t